MAALGEAHATRLSAEFGRVRKRLELRSKRFRRVAVSPGPGIAHFTCRLLYRRVFVRSLLP